MDAKRSLSKTGTSSEAASSRTRSLKRSQLRSRLRKRLNAGTTTDAPPPESPALGGKDSQCLGFGLSFCRGSTRGFFAL